MKVVTLVYSALMGALAAGCSNPAGKAPQTAAAEATAGAEAGLAEMPNGTRPTLQLGAVAAALEGDHRAQGNRGRDRYRHPAETLEFFGFEPSQTVLEYGPGRGWYTEVLAPALAGQGKLLITSPDPNGPADDRSTAYGKRIRQLLDGAPEVYGSVETVIVDGSEPSLELAESVDLALIVRGMHGMVNRDQLGHWLGEIHTALKPGGTLGVVQHRAKPGAVASESSPMGYLPEEWVIAQVEAAGFELLDTSELNANPQDTKDYEKGVWTLPPTLRLGDTDREKYTSIGESDRMTLKFGKK